MTRAILSFGEIRSPEQSRARATHARVRTHRNRSRDRYLVLAAAARVQGLDRRVFYTTEDALAGEESSAGSGTRNAVVSRIDHAEGGVTALTLTMPITGASVSAQPENTWTEGARPRHAHGDDLGRLRSRDRPERCDPLPGLRRRLTSRREQRHDSGSNTHAAIISPLLPCGNRTSITRR